MRQTLHELWGNPYARTIIVLALLAALLWFFYETRGPWIIFLLAYTLAYLISPGVTWLQRRRIPRWAGVLLALLALSLLLGLASLVIAGFVQQASEFVQRLPDVGAQLAQWYEDLPGLIRRVVPPPLMGLVTQPSEDITNALESSLTALTERLAQVGSNMFAALARFVGGVLQSVILLVLTVFLLHDFPDFNRASLRAFPKRYQGGVLELAHKLDVSVGGYIRGQLLIALIVGFLIWLGMTLLGVPLALGIGFIAGLFNLIPFLGPIVAFVPAALLTLTLGWPYLLATAGIFLAVNFLDGNVISPFVFSRTIRLHPMTVILSVVVGASLLGFWGALIGVPTAAFIKLLYKDYYLTSPWYQKENGYQKGSGPPSG